MTVNLKYLIGYSMKSGALDEHMATTAAIDAILKEGNNVKHAVRTTWCLTKDLVDKELRYTEKFSAESIDNLAEKGIIEVTLDMEDTKAVEDEKKREQAELIDNLYIRTKDDTTRQVITKWLELDKPTYSSVARALGIHAEIVRRKVKSLATVFDSELDGEIYEYL